MNTGKFRKKPVVIEAEQVTEASRLGIAEWCGGIVGEQGIVIPTLEGDMTAKIGDWVVKGVQGEFYPVKDDIFTATYDEVGGDSEADGMVGHGRMLHHTLVALAMLLDALEDEGHIELDKAVFTMKMSHGPEDVTGSEMVSLAKRASKEWQEFMKASKEGVS